MDAEWAMGRYSIQAGPVTQILSFMNLQKRLTVAIQLIAQTNMHRKKQN